MTFLACTRAIHPQSQSVSQSVTEHHMHQWQFVRRLERRWTAAEISDRLSAAEKKSPSGTPMDGPCSRKVSE